ncbi:probable tRNA wybutosine-synthesizing protein 1 [Saccharomycodes ludwigii]|uniref:S-adenosyl-L-methionine-dependent tRNA 4-demethylwyosine synthase n=1 Tax=Saccharomycodes ludwigii TaxID=36035 RepID=A0A376B486_9ASCO|nr:probable tRNA wybutosine-synthesizing protein 1 [Saccharomycodes ludwigii]
MLKLILEYLLCILSISLYLIHGGRVTIALAVIVGFNVYEYEKYQSKKNSNPPLVSKEEKPITKKKTCCGGKGGASCCSKNNKSNGKKCACSGGGGNCGKSKTVGSQGDEKKTTSSNVANNSNSVEEIDFTNAFKKVSSKKNTTKKSPASSKNVKVSAKKNIPKSGLTVSNNLLDSQIYILYSTLQGAGERAANTVKERLGFLYPNDLKKEPIIVHLDEVNDLEDYFVNVPKNSIYIMVVPSYDTDSPLDYSLETLDEISNDFRIDKYPLQKLVGFSVLGLGDSESWPEKFCYQAKQLDQLLSTIGGRRIFPMGQICMKRDKWGAVEEWADLLGETLKDNEPILYEYDEDEQETSEPVVDLEDIGKSEELDTTTKKMVSENSPTYKNLTKQGYTVIGSHSGVKICRWTKNDLRGRGSCYKHSLFNIVSSRCMELTPSLACSSKCVFCWRHGTNPVSKNWRWEIDEPEYILEEGLKGHYSKIKQMRGVPGVRADRFQKAFQVRHCALSLVGEPIMYPHINKFVELLHEKDISSFLVCNAQHPSQLKAMRKVTQLYLSIDAPTKSELKKVDRPLYKDFWERMMECLDIIRTTQSHQRTVLRLTLVKGFNMADVSSYADIVEKGLPCFIEVKGATFCGSSDGNGNPLTMQNIPYYEECVKFVESLTEELNRRGLEYGVAAEHAHSNCILIASRKFYIDGEWYTHIDFDKFFELLRSDVPFTNVDYIAKTPEWALFGSGGFAPDNVRFYRKKKDRNDDTKEQKQENVA